MVMLSPIKTYYNNNVHYHRGGGAIKYYNTMAKFRNAQGYKVTIDKGNNIFFEDKCMNPSKEDPTDWQAFNQDMVTKGIEDGNLTPIPEGAVITGHVANFSYGYGEDKVTVNTGYKSW